MSYNSILVRMTYYTFLQLRLDFLNLYNNYDSCHARLTQRGISFIRLDPKPEYVCMHQMCKQVDAEELYKSKEIIEKLEVFREEMITELLSNNVYIPKLYYGKKAI